MAKRNPSAAVPAALARPANNGQLAAVFAAAGPCGADLRLQVYPHVRDLDCLPRLQGQPGLYRQRVGGLLNLILGTQVDFLTQSAAFRTIYVASGIWQDAGWGCIIYLATLANVDPGLYEAAKVDGTSVFQRVRNIDLPALLPMAILNLIMAAGGLMNVGFEKVWLLQTDLNKATSDVIAVYVYEQGIQNAKYSYSTAVGLFNTVVNIALLLIVNKIASKVSDVEFV